MGREMGIRRDMYIQYGWRYEAGELEMEGGKGYGDGEIWRLEGRWSWKERELRRETETGR
jgi:hypothetical protein